MSPPKGESSKKRFIEWDGSCPVLDICNQRFLRVPRGRLELIGKVDELVGTSAVTDDDPWLTFEEAAGRIGLARKTLYEWKRTGRLRREHGLRMVGRSPRIDWHVFKPYIEQGGIS